MKMTDFSSKEELKDEIDRQVMETQLIDMAYDLVKNINQQILECNVSPEECKRVVSFVSKKQLINEALIFKANLITLQALLHGSKSAVQHYRYIYAVGEVYQDYLAQTSDKMHDDLGDLNKLADDWIDSEYDPHDDFNDRAFDERRDDAEL